VAWVVGTVAERASEDADECRSGDPFSAILERRDGAWLVQQLHWARARTAIPLGATSLDVVASLVEQERIDLCNCAAPDGTVTLLFSDIEDSTPLAERLGDLRWIDTLKQHNALIRECVARHDGEEVKTIGDAFMVAFGSARRALYCAIDIQRAFGEGACVASDDSGDASPLRVRIGLHAGEPVRDAGDFYGKSVVLASRIAGQARGGQILVSGLLRELAESAGDVRFDEGFDATLKGLAGTHRLYAVVPE
jgi:class 3 adenylate cyclase